MSILSEEQFLPNVDSAYLNSTLDKLVIKVTLIKFPEHFSSTELIEIMLWILIHIINLATLVPIYKLTE